MATPILNITELTAGEATPYATVNAMGRAIEAAANDWLELDFTSGNVALTDAQYQGYVLFRAANNTVARNLTLQEIKRLVVIDNTDGTAKLSIILGSTTLTLAAGEKSLYYTDGTANGLALVGGIDIPSFDTEATMDGAADYALVYDSSAGKHVKVLLENLPSGSGGSAVGEDKNSVAYLSDTKSSGTDGGTATSGSWFTRVIAEDADDDGIVSVSSNQFTLGAGTYEITALATALDCDSHQIRIRNITDGTTAIVGMSVFGDSSNNVGAESYAEGQITIGSTKVFELQSRVQTTKATFGTGVANSFGEDERYAFLKIVKKEPYNHQFEAGRLTVDFASDANYTLSTTAGSEEWKDKFLTFTDTGVVLTTGRDVIFPAQEGPEYIITNSTAQTLTLKISGQTGVTIATTVTGRYYYDGTDIVAAP